ncbi:MAG: magnesium transporter [Candidatus Thermoplasmatota archaeon]|nr:magnesium transporter [Candidatus Thermoplasmatota archaeon]
MSLPSIYRESLPVLLLAGLGLITAGLLLERMEEVLGRTPGLLVMIPALVALRGGISGAMGSRLGSAVHMGLIGKGNLWNEETRQNVAAALILSVALSSLVGALSHFTSILLGLESAGLAKLVLIATVAGTAAGTAQVGITFGIILIAFRRGLDPDNVTAPSLATVGDIITMLLLLVVSMGMGGFV